MARAIAIDCCGLQIAVGVESFRESSAVEHEIAAHGQGSKDREIGVGKAEDTLDGSVGMVGAAEGGPDSRHLPIEISLV